MNYSYDFVFVAVVYRNIDDLNNFILEIKKQVNLSYKIIIVNNHYNDEIDKKIREVALLNDCSLINTDNKGYGSGNNLGIEFAKKHFNFKFLVISNTDIIIKKFDTRKLLEYKNEKILFGPLIKTRKNKNQNPYWYKENTFTEYIIYLGYKYRNKLLVYLGVGINKIYREYFLYIFNKNQKKQLQNVFALHGSFVVISKDVINSVPKFYDEEMFLFSEEAHLAHKLKKYKIQSVLTKHIEILHNEDGTMSLEVVPENDIKRNSILTYYDKRKIKYE